MDVAISNGEASEVEHVSGEDMDIESFRERYISPEVPCIVEGLLSSWPALKVTHRTHSLVSYSNCKHNIQVTLLMAI